VGTLLGTLSVKLHCWSAAADLDRHIPDVTSDPYRSWSELKVSLGGWSIALTTAAAVYIKNQSTKCKTHES